MGSAWNAREVKEGHGGEQAQRRPHVTDLRLDSIQTTVRKQYLKSRSAGRVGGDEELLVPNRPGLCAGREGEAPEHLLGSTAKTGHPQHV